jgi:hypothetical protein
VGNDHRVDPRPAMNPIVANALHRCCR